MRSVRRPDVGKARKYDVAIYAPFAGHLYSADSPESSGGAETQMCELARALVRRGLRVCHAVFDYGGLPSSSEGVDLIPQPPDEFREGMVTYSRSMVRSLAKADASVYIQRTAGFETGVVGSFARARARRFIFSTSSTTDLARRPPLPSRGSLAAYQVGLRCADAVVVQTEDQLRLADGRLRAPKQLIRSFCRPGELSRAAPEAFLWIGGLIDYKDPLSYVALAERLPEAHFWLVGAGRGAEWQQLHERVAAAAARVPNLELLPARSRADLLELYTRAVAVVNTSHFEGYPNTFMEGWAHGAPALSLRVDPDGVIGRFGLGAVADGSIDALVDAARRLWDERDDRAGLAETVTRYVRETHAPERVADDWVELIERVLR